MTDLAFSVRGMLPKPWGCKEWAWRKLVADTARAAWPNENTILPNDTRFAVQLDFLYTSDRIRSPDLDNLAKPVLDTLFLSYRSQVKDTSLAGALFQVDDCYVYELLVSKHVVESEADCGVDIVIRWQESSQKAVAYLPHKVSYP